MKVAACILLCCFAAVQGAPEYDQAYEWRRPVVSYDGKEVVVPESTKVDSRNRVMLMSAQDEGLRGTPFYRSDSMHDFEKGLVALRPVGAEVCLLGDVKRSYDDTLRELESRQSGRTKPATERRLMEAANGEFESSSGSDFLDTFCQGRAFIRVNDREAYPGPIFPPFWPPLLCIWGPIDVNWPIEYPIEKWVGGFGFFP